MNRRKFIVNTGITAAGLLAGTQAFAKGGNKKAIGIQLYSLRDDIPTLGIDGTIRKIAAAGYNSIEVYGFNIQDGYFKKSAKEMAAILKASKVISPSGHYGYRTVVNETQKTIEAALTLGHKYITIPSIPHDKANGKDDFKKAVENINKAALECKKNKLRLAYHNHDFEFEKFDDGTCGYDIMLKEFDKSLVDLEMDIYWIARAGHNPLELFEQNPGRFKMWHVKDMDKNNPDLNTEIGTGSIDFSPIFKKAKLSGMEYFFVEQENFAIASDESIRKSLQYIKSNLLNK